MGLLSEIMQIASGLVSQVVDTQVESVCKTIRRQLHWYVWLRFATLLMLLGGIFAAWGACMLLEPAMGKGPAAIVVGGILLLIGIVVISLTKACHEK